MIAVVDTSVMIDHLRGVSEARDVLVGILDEGGTLASPVVTRTEILAGIRPGEAVQVRTLFSAIDWIDVDGAIADAAGDLAQTYLRSHPGVDTIDYLIAATVMAKNAQLLTRNVKHFPMFPGLQTPY